MTSRERLIATLNHQPVDRLCVDFGAGFQTGLGGAVHRLRQAVLGQPDHRVKVIESCQIARRKLTRSCGGRWVSMSWRAWSGLDVRLQERRLEAVHDVRSCTPVLVPEKFNVTPAGDGGWLIYPRATRPCRQAPNAERRLLLRRARTPGAARRVEARPPPTIARNSAWSASRT